MSIYDFIVIGGGAAGITAATTVKAARKRVAVVDHGPVGGLCSTERVQSKEGSGA